MTSRLSLPARRNHLTQKAQIAGQRTLCLGVHDDKQPEEIPAVHLTFTYPRRGVQLVHDQMHSHDLFQCQKRRPLRKEEGGAA
jgi:hypothetical protein